MSEFIERITRAAYEKFNENLIGCCEPPWDELPQSFKDRMMDAQRASVAAMREPSSEMLAVDVPDMPAGGGALDVWHPMIDAALNHT